MQYILTEHELNELRKKADRLDSETTDKIQRLCTLVADHMPSRKPWNWKEGDPMEPWGCILTEKREWYCDQCPVQNYCPNTEKEWSR